MSFVGRLSSSKSIFNRALVVQSFFPDLELVGHSKSDDVQLMKSALKSFREGKIIDCGLAGTVLRFMALRCSREVGRFELRCDKSLFDRPKNDLFKLLRQLGCDVDCEKNSIFLECRGWKIQGDSVGLPLSETSQVATAFLLSAWSFSSPLFCNLRITKDTPSFSYLKMTLDILSQLGMDLRIRVEKKSLTSSIMEIQIPPGQKVQQQKYIIEQDMSSIFSLVAACLTKQSLTIKDFPKESVQPDAVFVEILKKMSVSIHYQNENLVVEASGNLNGIEANLKNCADLFPSLSCLCGLAKSPSRLYGAPHLKFKESHRIEKIAELLRLAGADIVVTDEGLLIKKAVNNFSLPFDFNCEQDHRLAMAAAVLKMADVPVTIINQQVVSKSFPEFWDIIHAQ